MPLRRNAHMVKLAVHSINWGMTNSPIGTAKNKKPKGKMISRVIGKPNTAGTASTSNVTSASWVTALMAAKSPNNQTNAAQATTNRTLNKGCGVWAARRLRCLQTSQSEMGGTRKAWVKVSDRAQMVTMAMPVSWYKNRIQASSRSSAGTAWRQDCAKWALGLRGCWLTIGFMRSLLQAAASSD